MTPVLQGLIEHARFVKDYASERKYNILLVKPFADKGMQERAFDEVCNVLDLDFSKKVEIKESEFRKDLWLLLDKSEWATNNRIPQNLKKCVMKMPDIPEKHLIVGVFYYVLEKYKLAQKRLERAYDVSVSGKQKVYILLQMCRVNLFQSEFEETKKCIGKLEKYKLTDNSKISFMGYKGLAWGLTGRLDEGINLIEEYIPTIETKNDPNYFIELGTIHNNLAILYHKKKMLDEAYKNFETARKIWEKINYKRKLATIYNNIGDVALTKGNPNEAFEYFRKAVNICSQIDSKRIKVLSVLNQGQAYIKLGLFNIAERYIDDALTLTLKLETKPFYDSIINNLAIAKSKINNFVYYYKFVEEKVPDLIN
ncbi:MAG: tetratricopeptide repeat protein, partial [Candidatus Cloacimonetes bacterium]|nr:tetratricopeptide repeat protein [Candidatus Cloacimonadota bacterium]